MKPILFKIFGFPIHSYGVLLVIGFFLGLLLARKRAPRFGVDPQKMTDGLIVALFVGVIGARLAFIIQELPYYLSHPHELFSLEFAGLTSFGGILFGLLAILIWAKRTNTKMLAVLDTAAPGFLIGMAVGRIGCFLNGCCYGSVCAATVPLRIHVFGDPFWHYPAQLYDSAFHLISLGILLLAERKFKLHLGQSVGLALSLSGLSRFIYEFWRGGTADEVAKGLATSEYWFGHITQAQGAAFVVFLLGVGFLVFCRGTSLQSSKAVQAQAVLAGS